MNKLEDSIQIVNQLKNLMDKEREKWKKNPEHLIYYSRLTQDTSAVTHMIAALTNNLESMRDEYD
jgi:hypothetical protein